MIHNVCVNEAFINTGPTLYYTENRNAVKLLCECIEKVMIDHLGKISQVGLKIILFYE